MALAFVGAAVLGTAVSELYKAVIQARAKSTRFKPELEKLKRRIESVIPSVEIMKRLDRPDVDRLITLLNEGTIPVEKCSAVQSWKYISKKKYSGDLQKLDSDIHGLLEMDHHSVIYKLMDQVDQGFKQLAAERENGGRSSSNTNNGAGAKDGDGGVNDLKASVPIKPGTIMSSVVPQKLGSAKVNEKLDRTFVRLAPIKPDDYDQKAAVPITPAIILTSADPQKADSAKARSGRHSENSASIKPYNHDLEAEPIGLADPSQCFMDCINSMFAADTPELATFRDDECAWFGKSFGGVARTSLSLDLKALLDYDTEEIKTNFRDTEYEPHPWVLSSKRTNSSATICKFPQVVVLTSLYNYGPLAISYYSDSVKREHLRHMELVESVRHQNVVPLRAYYFRPAPDKQPPWMNVKIVFVYDYYRKGSVRKMMHGKLKVPFDWDARLRAAIGAARGIAFIHRQDNGTFFHGGIKSENIFLNTGNYGCISELGKCVAGNRERNLAGSRARLRELDVYNYGIFLLELVTGKLYKGVVEDFKTYVGSMDQLDDKFDYFIRTKQLNREELYFQMLDPELANHYGELKGQLIQMLRIAWKCVANGVNRAPKMTVVVKMVEFIGRLQLPHEFLYPFQD